MYNKWLICLLITLFFAAQAQQKYLNSEQLIREGYLALKDQDYDDAIESFAQVNENDNNYFDAQYEISLCYYYKKEYDTSILFSRKLLDANYENENNAHLYINLGNCYNRLEKYKEAIAIAEEGIQKFPRYFLLYYNKAIYLNNSKQFQEAVNNVQKAIYLNPNHANSHILLGQIAADQGMLVQAMLCFNTAIFIDPDDKSSLGVLKYLNTIVSQKYDAKESNIKLSEKGDDFSSIEEIIRAQAALNPKYKIEADVDFPVIRQNQALFSYLQNHTGSEGFFEKYYVPFYKEVYAKKYFNLFSYLLVLTSENENTQAKIKKNMKSIVDFYQWSSDAYITKCGKRQMDGIEGDVYFLYDEGNIARIGGVNDKLESHGKWIYTYPNGNTSAEGEFINNKADGFWKFYHPNQKLRETKTFKTEIVDGVNTFYYDNGAIKEKVNFVLDSMDGNYEEYNYYGVKTVDINFVNNKKEGPCITYHTNGKKRYEMIYKNGKLNGLFVSYYPNGTKEYEVEMKDDKKNGKFVEYYVNGNLKEEYVCKDGLREGPYKSYYKDKTLSAEGAYKNNKQVGTCKTYYANGMLASVKELDMDGNEAGITKDYDYDGVQYSEMLKNKKKIFSLKYFDKSGNIIYESKVKDNSEIALYRPDGTLSEKGNVLGNNKDGLWTEYYTCGTIASTVEYKNGLRDGQSKFLYPNANIKAIYYYRSDSLIGTYAKYYINGKLSFKGHSYDDHYAGLTTEFHKSGALSEKHYLNDEGDIHGKYEYFDDYGKPRSVQLYHEGTNYGEYMMDTNGTKYYSQNYKAGSEKVQKRYYSDLEKVEFTLVNGVTEGDYTFTSNKIIKSRGSFINEQRDGLWTWHGILDSLSASNNYELGSKEGIQKYYTIDGRPYLEYSMLNNENHGKFIKYYYNGNKYYETNFIDGVEHGVKTIFGINGEKIVQLIVNNDDIVAYITNGNNKELSDTVKIEKGTGTIIGKYKSGVKAIEFSLKNGLYDGKYIVYGTDQKPLIESNNVDGDFQGERITYFANGKVYLKEQYNDDELEGVTEVYRENGTKKATINYYNDNANGEMNIYDNTGKLIEVRTYYNHTLMNVKKI